MTDSEREATELLEEWMAAFNARDVDRWAATFNFPSVRLASGRLVIFENASSIRRDMFERLTSVGWDRSTWDHHRVINSSDNKVHFDTRFTRYRADGSVIGTYDSIYVVTRQDGHWGVAARSSFAP
jgi:hypothetical protein